jgi:hypothetical protein
MRKLVLGLCFVFASTSAAMAQGKVSVKWDCAKPSLAHNLEVPDQPNHVYSISQVKCTTTAGEIAGVKQKEGVGTEFHEITGTSDRFRGVFVETLANGDKVTYTYEGTATIKAGLLEAGGNKWSATGGTGSLKGIKALGSCKGSGRPDGSTLFDCSGDYSIAK